MAQHSHEEKKIQGNGAVGDEKNHVVDEETQEAELYILMQAVKRYFEKTGAKKFSAYSEEIL